MDTLDSILKSSWIEDALPLLQDSAMSSRVERAGWFALAGTILGGIADVAIQAYTKKESHLGKAIGLAAGAAFGAFSPEVIDWAQAYARLDSDAASELESRVRKRVVSQEVEQLLQLFQLSPHSPAEELRSAWLRKAQETHPDHNDAPDARVRFVASKAAFDKLADLYSRGELPVPNGI